MPVWAQLVVALLTVLGGTLGGYAAVLRSKGQNQIEGATQRETAKDTLVEFLQEQLKEERIYRRGVDQHNSELVTLIRERFGETEKLRQDFIKLDDSNQQLLRELRTLQVCDKKRVAEMEELKAENSRLQDRVSLLETTLQQNGIAIPTADRRRADIEPKQLEA